MARVEQSVLARLGDSWCDLLVAGAARGGAASVIAEYARAVADCNRGESDMSPDEVAPDQRDRYTTPGRKERAGLGVVPTRLAPHGALWWSPIDDVMMAARLDALHRPYHAAVAAAIAEARAVHGWALLIDLHSMPPIPMGQQGYGAQIVIGDGFGTTSAGWMCDQAARIAQEMGVRVSVNQPYAGGHIIRRHSDRTRDVHGLQIEIERGLYLDRADQPVAKKVAGLSNWLARLVQTLTDQHLRGESAPLAAE